MGDTERPSARAGPPAGAQNGGFRVLIAGGGIAALEGLLALRALAGDLVSIELMSPSGEFVFRPLVVLEPFELRRAPVLSLAEVAAAKGATYRQDALAAVQSERHAVRTRAGEELGYDALLIAIGTRPLSALDGSLTFGGRDQVLAYRELLGECEAGSAREIAFVVPEEIRWPLALYELALLTASHLSDRGVSGVGLTVVTHEARPLALFGRRASEHVARLLAQADISLRTRCFATGITGRQLMLRDGWIAADHVVTMPAHRVEAIPGLPQGKRGFIPTNDQMKVDNALWHVFAAGDATWFPVKQGGIAAQQADVAAAAIASLAGAPVEPASFHPVFRGTLVTGSTPQYLRAAVGERDGTSAISAAPLWWPPGKVAGRYLAPFLIQQSAGAPLVDSPDAGEQDLAEAEAEHQDFVRFALEAADADAREEDYEAALRWLEVVEELSVALPPRYARLRASWEQALGTARSADSAQGG